MVLQHMRTPPKGGQLEYYNFLLGHPLRTVVKANLVNGLDFSSAPGSAVHRMCGRRKGQACAYILRHGLWPVVFLDGQGLGRNVIRKLMTIILGKRYVGRSEWAKTMKIFVFYINAYKRVAAAEEYFNN